VLFSVLVLRVRLERVLLWLRIVLLWLRVLVLIPT
jgi:hypothetical protein